MQKKNARKLVDSGITEINISTGLDHQKWIPQESVIRAFQALLDESISTLLVVESDTEKSSVFTDIKNSLEVSKYSRNPLFSIKCNSWMAFNSNIEERQNINAENLADRPCDQIFNNVVVTPYRNLSACCGLTLEYIKEVHLGRLDWEGSNLVKLYWSQLNDFLKIWIHMDGPTRIIKTLLGEEKAGERKFVHMCESCSVLHNDPEIRKALESNYLQFAPKVLSRFLMKQEVKEMEIDSVKKIHVGYQDFSSNCSNVRM